MRTVLVFELELDKGKRPTTRFRRVDRLARLTAEYLSRLRSVEEICSVSVCDSDALGLLRPELRYDGRQLAPPATWWPVGIQR